jgi:hypothetical protein
MIDLETTPTIEEALDRLAIHDVLARQAMGNDTLDADLWKSAFWPDATEDHGWYDGNAHAFVDETVPMLLADMAATWHQVGLPLLAIEGATARSVSCFFAYCRMRATDGRPESDLLSGGRYVDRLEKRAGRWRIARRISKGDWIRFDPPAFDWNQPSINGHVPRMGLRAPDDPARLLFGRCFFADGGEVRRC